ncbi:hypothetical protein M569_04118 [Genlisea aurea]|uniref:HNH nuclease domain-containing protein n=1 Tax=Genlisea aurea TaxID=192259 RepID=S8CV19_9LAMI|nr:hypothetical protein M569_04118 [Genlisea aurea]
MASSTASPTASGRGRRKKHPSAGRNRHTSPPPSASPFDGEFIIADSFESLQISPAENPNPRSFPHSVKQQCWEKAEKVKGRDPDRWRRDALGNVVFRKFVGCRGCLCHDYDHILPYSKGGKSTLENCQVLQATANRSKGNQIDVSRSDLIKKSAYCRITGRDMDLLELTSYGDLTKTDADIGCKLQ